MRIIDWLRGLIGPQEPPQAVQENTEFQATDSGSTKMREEETNTAWSSAYHFGHLDAERNPSLADIEAGFTHETRDNLEDIMNCMYSSSFFNGVMVPPSDPIFVVPANSLDTVKTAELLNAYFSHSDSVCVLVDEQQGPEASWDDLSPSIKAFLDENKVATQVVNRAVRLEPENTEIVSWEEKYRYPGDDGEYIDTEHRTGTYAEYCNTVLSGLNVDNGRDPVMVEAVLHAPVKMMSLEVPATRTVIGVCMHGESPYGGYTIESSNEVTALQQVAYITNADHTPMMRLTDAYTLGGSMMAETIGKRIGLPQDVLRHAVQHLSDVDKDARREKDIGSLIGKAEKAVRHDREGAGFREALARGTGQYITAGRG